MLKAACHIHSNWSYDAKWPLESLAAKFSRWGYGVLMMTEHDKGFTQERFIMYRAACARASSAKIFILPGIEYSDPSNTTHVMVWGTIPFMGEGLPTSMVLETVQSANGVVVLSHPSRLNAWKCFDSNWSQSFIGIELWNRKTDGWAPSQMAQQLLQETGAIPFVGLDFHDRRQLFPLAMDLDLNTSVTEESIINCLRSRRCYASAFGVRLTEKKFNRTLPVMRAAEFARRNLAKVLKRSNNQRKNKK